MCYGCTMSNVWLLAILAVLSTARLTRLITADYVTRSLRGWVHRRFGTDSKIGYMVVCDWCLSVYVGAVVATVLWWHVGVVPIVALALSASYLTGLLTRLEPPIVDDGE